MLTFPYVCIFILRKVIEQRKWFANRVDLPCLACTSVTRMRESTVCRCQSMDKQCGCWTSPCVSEDRKTSSVITSENFEKQKKVYDLPVLEITWGHTVSSRRQGGRERLRERALTGFGYYFNRG